MVPAPHESAERRCPTDPAGRSGGRCGGAIRALREALAADARITAHYRGERDEFPPAPTPRLQCVRLAVVSDAFLGQASTGSRRGSRRAACRCCRAGAPPRDGGRPGLDRRPGGRPPRRLRDPRSDRVDGLVEIHSGVTIAPFVTIGLRAGNPQGGDGRARRQHRDRRQGDRAGADRRGRDDRRQRGRHRRRRRGHDRGRRAGAPAPLTATHRLTCGR